MNNNLNTKELIEEKVKKLKKFHSKDPKVIASQIKSQKGCRYYQNKITKDHSFANKILYVILKPSMVELINDQFGNYLYQEFIDILDTENMKHFIQVISENFECLFYSSYGTRVVQKLLEKVNQEDQINDDIFIFISKKLKGNVEHMSNDENASHIIQKFISLIRYPMNSFVYEEIYKSFLSVSTTKFGCCVIQKCMSFGNPEQKKIITTMILDNTFLLISNQFGNYVYQNLIIHGEEWTVTAAYRTISKDIISLCKEKYSSNVIEKFFEIKNKALINEVAKCILQYESKVSQLVFNQYGNYIIQKILKTITDQTLIEKALSIIGKNAHIIRKISFGKRLLNKLLKKYPILYSYINN